MHISYLEKVVPQKYIISFLNHGIKDTNELSCINTDVLNIPPNIFTYCKCIVSLARIPYIGPIFAAILVNVGILSIDTLANQEPISLRDRIINFNSKNHYSKTIPSLSKISNWIVCANQLLKTNSLE